MKRLLLLLIHAAMAIAMTQAAVNIPAAATPESDGYMPMFEVGKEWRYTIPDHRAFTDVWFEDKDRRYRVDDTTEIDGKTYYVVNTYTDGAQEPDSGVPFGYFREEIAEKAVYFRFNDAYDPSPIVDSGRNWRFEEIKLYDFSAPNEGGIALSFYGHPLYETSFTGNAKEHRGFACEAESSYGFFEGLGFIYRDKAPEKPFWMLGYDLTGPFILTTGGSSVYTYLYSIVAADGTQLYSMDINRPAGVEAVRCDGDDEAPVYYNLQGIRVDNPAKGEVVIRCIGTKAEKIIF